MHSVIRGTVEQVDPTQFFGQKGFRKRQVILSQKNGRFENYIPVEFVGDACDTADHIEVGTEIDVVYKISGRKYQKDANSDVKYFVSIEAIGYLDVEQRSDRRQTTRSTSNRETNSNYGDDTDHDMPF